MSQLYLYGIINSPDAVSINASGITSSGPFILPFKDIGIIASKYMNENTDINLDNLSKHDAVINELFQSCCILPFSFNTILKNESHANMFILEKYHLIKQNFEKLKDKSEMGLKVLWNTDKIKHEINMDKKLLEGHFIPDTPAKAYLQQKMLQYGYRNELQSRAELLKQTIVKGLSSITKDIKIKLFESERMALNISFLIDTADNEQFVQFMEKLKPSHNDLAFLPSGPWAPYNFVDFD